MVHKQTTRFQVRFKEPSIKSPQEKRLLNVGTNIEQKPWSPTKRKGKNTSEKLRGKPSYKSIAPLLGPNIIDSRKRSAPAFSFGRNDTRRQNIIDEGPAKYNVAGVYNKGIHKPPAFTIKSRPKDITKCIGPEATKYKIESAFKATTNSIPSYSFGKRPVAIQTLPTPAPNCYNLPPILGTAKESHIKAAPEFSLVGRQKPRQIPLHVFPGPGDYEDNSSFLRKLPPKFSMHIKHKVISDEHQKPGPGAYKPEMSLKHKSVPAPSFAIRHSPYLVQKKAYLVPEGIKGQWDI
uniref:Uncharacterized protein n=1 Tax=Stomoxys calcitrans TaxID=35570 RepID=A0A1I8NPF3_STOCA